MRAIVVCAVFGLLLVAAVGTGEALKLKFTRNLSPVDDDTLDTAEMDYLVHNRDDRADADPDQRMRDHDTLEDQVLREYLMDNDDTQGSASNDASQSDSSSADQDSKKPGQQAKEGGTPATTGGSTQDHSSSSGPRLVRTDDARENAATDRRSSSSGPRLVHTDDNAARAADRSSGGGPRLIRTDSQEPEAGGDSDTKGSQDASEGSGSVDIAVNHNLLVHKECKNHPCPATSDETTPEIPKSVVSLIKHFKEHNPNGDVAVSHNANTLVHHEASGAPAASSSGSPSSSGESASSSS